MGRMRPMPIPYPSSMIGAQIPPKGADLCTLLRQTEKIKRMVSANFSYLFGSDGKLSDQAKLDLCAEFAEIGPCTSTSSS